MAPPPACELDGLEVYVPTAAKPWNQIRAHHLYRRLSHGASLSTVNSALGQNPATLIDTLVDEAVALPTTPAPTWGYWTLSDYADPDTEAPLQIVEWSKQFVVDLVNNGLREKMVLFWHNHFVTQNDVYICPSHLFQYYHLLQTHSLGNFRDFVHAMGIEPAMIVFLNAYENTAVSPNENYARELYELFTLGVNNGYTEQDIVETAKALTGWNGFTDFCGPITFVPENHSEADKTIFGQTGNWGYDDVIEILFTQRTSEIAYFISQKLYRFFVSPTANDEMVQAMADEMIANDFDIAPMLKLMFKSEHFFDEDIIGVRIKSPMDMVVSLVNDGNMPFDDEVAEAMHYFGSILGQRLFNPVDVAGWQEDHDWVNSETLTARWLVCDYYLGWVFLNYPDALSQLALSIVGPTTDPALATQKIVDYFIPRGLQTMAEYDQATTVFKWEIPQNYFDLNIWNMGFETIPAQMAVLMQHIFRMPEFQLT